MEHVYHLDIHGLLINQTDLERIIETFKNVKFLNMSYLGNAKIQFLSKLKKLKSVDFQFTELDILSSEIFLGMKKLQYVYSSNFKLCCQQILPPQVLSKNCFAPKDAFSSCEDLLKSDISRLFLWVFFVVAVTGNVGCFIFRITQKYSTNTGIDL